MALGSRFPPLVEVRLRGGSPGADRYWGAPCLLCAWDAGRMGDKGRALPLKNKVGFISFILPDPFSCVPWCSSLHVNLPSRDQAWWQDLALIIRGKFSSLKA